MTLHLVTVIYDFLCAKYYVIHILLDRIKSKSKFRKVLVAQNSINNLLLRHRKLNYALTIRYPGGGGGGGGGVYRIEKNNRALKFFVKIIEL